MPDASGLPATVARLGAAAPRTLLSCAAEAPSASSPPLSLPRVRAGLLTMRTRAPALAPMFFPRGRATGMRGLSCTST